MTPERWRRITEVFHLARARETTARAALLDEVCADDAALRADVESMLAADAAAARFDEVSLLPPATPPQLLAGACLGPYQIKTLLGAGGMGEVYHAHDTRLNRDVAIKLLSATASGEANARLKREARAAAALNHPHVCTIHEVGEIAGHAYIVMELVDGAPLDQLIPASGLPVDEIVRYGRQIADAIAHAHERGIVHRDLKPANVMISRSGVAKVLDFGLAKVRAPVDLPQLNFTAGRTASGVLIGTAAYMSPEQILGHSTDERSDIFSFGVVLYEMATGRPAFAGATPMELLDAVLHASPQPASAVRRELPARLAHVTEKALAKDPSQRYQRIEDLAADLRMLERPATGAWVKATAMTVVLATATALIWVGSEALRERSRTLPSPAPVEDVTAGTTRVVVLPFENLTRQPDDDWMASAFSDALTSGLQSLEQVLFVSRASIAQAYNEQSLPEAGRLEPALIEHVSKRLNVSYYVHGSYQRIGDRLRVAARLVEISTGTIKAQESVTDRVDNLLQLEDALARRFAASLESGSTLARHRPTTTSLLALRAITEGRGFYAASRWPLAHEAFKRAVDLDSEYAEAWAMLAKSYARLAAPASVDQGSVHEYRSRALAAAKRAFELDPSSYEVSVALALAYRATSQVALWRAAARDAIAINPRVAEAYSVLGDSYADHAFNGCNREPDSRLGVSYARQAVRLDPTVGVYRYNLMNQLRFAGRFAEAQEAAEEALRVYPHNTAIRRGASRVFLAVGRTDEAERLLRQVIADGGPSIEDRIELALIDLKRGRVEAAGEGFRTSVPQWGHYWRPFIALAYLEAGLPKPAIDQLEETFRAEPACARWLLTTQSAYWTPIRANADARAVLEKFGSQDR